MPQNLSKVRTAHIDQHDGRPSLREVNAYMPHNYIAWPEEGGGITIQGVDDHGWTLDEYVIPRLASGMITAHETT
jgi:hypothetical protein